MAATPHRVLLHTFDALQLSPAETYKLLAGSVVPRPIAWVSTTDGLGNPNLAPFSFFTVASANPPVLCFCVANRSSSDSLGPTKDTLENIRATREFVVNFVSEELVEAMNQTAAQVASHVDEFELAGLTALPGQHIRAPRVAEARVQMECRLREVVSLSTLPAGGTLVLGDVVCFHVSDEVLEPGLHIAPEKLRAVGRMAGSGYIRTQDSFELERPG